jgi:hypothetical protein
MHNEELHNLYYSQSIIKVIEWKRVRWLKQVALKEEISNARKRLFGKPEENRSFGRFRCVCVCVCVCVEGYLKTDVK